MKPFEIVPYAFWFMIAMFMIALGIHTVIASIVKVFKKDNDKINEAIVTLKTYQKLVPDKNFEQFIQNIINILE